MVSWAPHSRKPMRRSAFAYSHRTWLFNGAPLCAGSLSGTLLGWVAWVPLIGALLSNASALSTRAVVVDR